MYCNWLRLVKVGVSAFRLKSFMHDGMDELFFFQSLPLKFTGMTVQTLPKVNVMQKAGTSSINGMLPNNLPKILLYCIDYHRS